MSEFRIDEQESWEQQAGYSGQEDYWIPESELCRKCHKKRIDRSENSHSILCRECREEQIRYPFPKKMIPVVILVLAVIAAAMVRTPKSLECYKIYSQSVRQAAAGEIYPVLLDLQSVLDVYPDSVQVAERMVELAMKYGYYDAAAYVMNEYLEGKSVSDSTYKNLTFYADKLNRFYDTQERINELLTEADAAIEAGSEQEEALEELKGGLLALADKEEYDSGIIYYLTANLTEDQNQAEEYLRASIKADPRLNAAAVALGTNLRRRGDFEGARECYLSVYARDRHDAGMLRAMGILELLLGDQEQGLAHIRQAYEENPEETYVKESLIIALMECGQTEEASSLKKQFEDEGMTVDEEFAAYLNGEVDYYDYYVSPQ